MDWGRFLRRAGVGAVALLPCGLVSTSLRFSTSTGIAGVSEARAASAHVNILDATRTLTPSAADYGNDYVELTGASGLRVQVWTNSATGCVLYVKCADAAPQIALDDLLVRTLTAPGPGGTSMTTFTPISAADQALWSTRAAVPPWLQINTDLRIQNLYAYPDGIAPGTTAYTDNLTFTVIVQ